VTNHNHYHLSPTPLFTRLLSIEINPHFHALANNIEDERLIAHLGSAYKLKTIISNYGLDAPDVAISGIPFSTMSNNDGFQVIDAISSRQTVASWHTR
jgi:phosphatidylethanolamine/phosphatidyl-N-methylethanolamine N-methyltransferase